MVANRVDAVSAHARSENLRIKIIALSIPGIATIASCALYAQDSTVIKTDASWGRTFRSPIAMGSATTVIGNKGTAYNVRGNVFTVPQSIAKVSGIDLSHSFESLRVGPGDAAVFTTQSQFFTNVIRRVSGSSASSIGLIALQPAAGNKPNFFFIDRNEITFGAGAQIDAPVAFHDSTAREFRALDSTLAASK
jgi:filamentous hemagglutinin family protein